MKSKRTKSNLKDFAAGVGRALRCAAKDAQKIARMYNTAVYYWESNKVVARKPWLSTSARKKAAALKNKV
jgi:hypothetical protein